MTDIIKRLDHEPSYCENSDAKQLRADAAHEIRRLNVELWSAQREIDSLRNVMHAESRKMGGRAAA
jgi:hypothetical protein